MSVNIRFTGTFCAIALMLSFSACQKPEQPVTPALDVQTTAVSFDKDGGDIKVSFTTNVDWAASTSADWITLSPKSGTSSKYNQELILTASANDGDDRTAEVTIKTATLSATVAVSQKSSSYTISQFLAQPTGNSVWYRIKAKIASVADSSYGNFYVTDDTGYLYVYGLTAKKAATNDQSFSSLNLKVGDEVTFMTHRSKYGSVDEAGGTVPAYYMSHTSGSYHGIKAASTSAGWMELPGTSSTDGYDILIHYMLSSSLANTRSYSIYWDYNNLVARWEAYPVYKGSKGSGSRSDAWALDPLLDPDKQPILSKKSYQVGNGGTFIRGHQVPSADRLNFRDNLELFFGTNIMPQNSDFNVGVWSSLENDVRDWGANCDTLYVVTGCDVAGSTTYVLDNADKHVTVPAACYKAVLRYSKTDGYIGLGVYLDNAASSKTTLTKDMTMSIDDLEKKLGIDLFVNLPAAVGKDAADKIEAEKPSGQSWWWN